MSGLYAPEQAPIHDFLCFKLNPTHDSLAPPHGTQVSSALSATREQMEPARPTSILARHHDVRASNLKIEGWVRKRRDANEDWRRRYFVVCDVFGQGPSLVYFASRELAHRMLDLGEGTFRGILPLVHVEEVLKGSSESALEPDLLEICTSGHKWLMQPENPEQYLDWLHTVEREIQICKAAHPAAHSAGIDVDTAGSDVDGAVPHAGGGGTAALASSSMGASQSELEAAIVDCQHR